MSVYRDPRSRFWRHDSWIDGFRVYGSTKKTTRREAEAVERQEREKAKRRIAQQRAAATSLRLDDIAGRYWTEVGQHHAGADNTERLLTLLIGHFGENKLIAEITDDDVTKLVAWRRGHRVARGTRLISPFTVNDTTEQLKKLFTRAKAWNVRFEHEPAWKKHWLKEPKERVRELHQDEAERLQAEMRDDYAPFFDFIGASGLRWNVEARVLRWTQVFWREQQIKLQGKGGTDIVIPITSTIREILWPLQGHHPEFVFTYVAQRTVGNLVKGKRYPVTKEGTKTAWRRLRKRAGIASGAQGFRLHDARHDLATKLLRKTGNLKLVQRALNHASVTTTAKYAHVLTEEVAAALAEVQEEQTDARRNTKSPNRGVRRISEVA
jgi:integrase